MSTSLSLRRRQCGHRYAIRAGRNLPDKEFRYLRTVIVTAAVYRGFDQGLAPHQLTFRHRAGVTPYTSTYVFAECCVLSKQLQGPGIFDRRWLTQQVLHLHRRTFSRSYGAILPSSFTQVLSSALVFSTQPPVSVWGTVSLYLKLRGFSWEHGINHFSCQRQDRHQFSALSTRIYLSTQPTTLNTDYQRRDGLAFSVPPSQYKEVQEY